MRRGAAHPVRTCFRAYLAAAAAASAGLAAFNHLPGWGQVTVVTWAAAAFAVIPVVPVTFILTAVFAPDETGAAAAAAVTRHPRPLWRVIVRQTLGITGRLLRVALMGMALTFTVFMLPFAVNAAGYLAGAGHSTVFVPVTQGAVSCGRGGCNSSTAGYLVTGSGHVPATWPNIVQTGVPFPVRSPAWNAPGTELVSGYGFALTRLGLWVMATLWDLLFIPMGVLAFRFRRRNRRA